MMIFQVFHELPIGTRLIPGKDGFEGLTDSNGNFCNNAAVIVAERTKEEFLNQFDGNMLPDTWWYVEHPESRFYEIITD